MFQMKVKEDLNIDPGVDCLGHLEVKLILFN